MTSKGTLRGGAGRFTLRAVTLGVTAIVLAGCAQGFEHVQSENRAKLYLLERGMTKEQVLEAMGTEPQEYNKGVFADEGIVPNPFDAETHVSRGLDIEILYYATHIRNTDGEITSDELTPLVLADEQLVGWGWNYLAAFAEEYDLTLVGPPIPVLEPTS